MIGIQNHSFKTKEIQRRRGFALLFAVLASSVLLLIAAAIWNISFRELVLSSYGRESVIAFYAADTGAECALYWDIKTDAFSTTTSSNIDCGTSQSLPPVGGGGNSNPISTVNNINLGGQVNSPCVNIQVTKQYSGTPKALVTTIQSYGHNSCDTSDPMLLERGLRVTY